MQTSNMPTRLVPGLLATALLLPAAASAQSPSGERTITALGSARVKVQRPAKLSSPTIAAAVDAARVKATPAAVANAQARAQLLASSAGMTLGALRSISEGTPSPFVAPPFVYGVDGTFGPGKYCGTIRTPVFKRNKAGRRVVTKVRRRFGCRVPAYVATSVSATFAAS